MKVVDVSRLEDRDDGRTDPLFLGICGLILVETTVFATLVATWFYLRLVAPQWPPAGVDPPKLTLPLVGTAVLLASSLFVRKADTAVRKNDQRWLRAGLAVGIALALTFLAIKYAEYSAKPYRWDSHAYGSIVWTISGFHAAHVIALVLKTVVVEFHALRGRFDARHNIAVRVNGMYWQFVVIVWLPLFAVLYLAPRALDGGAP